MHKKDLVIAIVEKSGLTKKDAEAALNAITAIVMETVSSGDKVQLVGFGTFEPRNRAARQVTNPQTREKFMAPAAVVPIFKAGQTFRTAVASAAAKKEEEVKKIAPKKKK
ncbi:MAG: HU family DNA-binding protein [Symbiobacteriaceae bacterium]|nr:HU family DNA-binding protein [Symbiobacteriaceae bacterium]